MLHKPRPSTIARRSWPDHRSVDACKARIRAAQAASNAFNTDVAASNGCKHIDNEVVAAFTSTCAGRNYYQDDMDAALKDYRDVILQGFDTSAMRPHRGPGGARQSAMTGVMAVLNLTPDSFSDGGRYPTPEAAVQAGRAMQAAGAAIIDIGAESTRPGAAPVAAEAEIARLLPVVGRLAAAGLTLSIDTRNAATMQACLDAGATWINDVSALTHDPAAAPLIARRGCRVILMHMRGTPQTMAGLAVYTDLIGEIRAELLARRAAAEAAGIARGAILLDPGLGFAKTAGHNLAVLGRLSEFADLGPLVVGASRKRFIGELSGGAPPDARLGGSIAAAVLAAQAGAAYVRVHDVVETVQALRLLAAAGSPP